MTIHQIFEIDEKIGDLYQNGEPAIVPERSVGTAIAKLMARRMANGGNAHIGDIAHVQQLMQCGIPKTTAKRIVKKARNMATGIQPMPEPEVQPQAPENSQTIYQNEVPRPRNALPTLGAVQNPSAPLTIHECTLTEYLKLLPETLPRPIRTIVRPKERSEAMRNNLQNLRNELFLPGTGQFNQQLRYQAPSTSNNPFGLYQLSAPITEKPLYAAIWDAIGNNNIPPLWFPAILPYLAEEGLLEYYNVNPDLVIKFEQIRQTYLSDGLLQAYDRNSTFIPKTKPPYAPDGYVFT